MKEGNTHQAIHRLVNASLKEDIGSGDVTIKALISNNLQGLGLFIAKQAGIIAGMIPACLVFDKIDQSLEKKIQVMDGDRVLKGEIILKIQGSVSSLLQGERTALNFLQHLSGIATQTSKYVEAIKGTKAKILDTRKTLPGFRLLEKAAVKAGGGNNHRAGLYDMILIKDNHLKAVGGDNEAAAVGIAIRRAKQAAPPGMLIQVEVTCLEAALEAGRCGADMVLLDNMSPDQMADVVENYQKEFDKFKPLIEASGGIDLNNIKEVAASGVDRISIGALTHSAPALDIAMYIEIERSL